MPMKLLVSACLMGKSCKYNGGHNYSQEVVDFAKTHEVYAVCPEVLGGLPVPRCPAEIVDGVVTASNGTIVDKEYRIGAARALAQCPDADLAILQPRSPSCGCCQVYDGTFSHKLIPGRGVFAALLAEHHVPMVDADCLQVITEKGGSKE